MMDETMTVDEALAELAAVGANIKLWHSMQRRTVLGSLSQPTIYINGANRTKLAEVWVSPAGHVSCRSVWRAVAAVVNAR